MVLVESRIFFVLMALAVAVYSLSARAAQDLASNATECLSPRTKEYRSLPGIIWSCLTTTFLCIWVALHLNVPEPVDTRGLGYLTRFKIWTKSVLRCNVVPIIVTLVFPEWVLGMAILQFTKATRLAKDIGATRQQGFFIIMGGFHLFERGQQSSYDANGEQDEESNHLLFRKSALEAGDGRREYAPSKRATKAVDEEFGKPIHPLDEFDVRRLIKDDKLLLPTPAELQDKCKNDGLAKFLVIVQTLWFIAHCIARKVSNLPLTELEVVTLGYTLLTVAMYIAWWDKPYRVTFPVRVYETLPERTEEQKRLKQEMEEHGLLSRALAYAVGVQGGYVDLRSLKQVPMFHSGYNKDEGTAGDLVGFLTTIIVGTVFGAVHFLAWSSPFPSHHMQFLWRFASIVMTAVPPAAIVVLFSAVGIDKISRSLGMVIMLLQFLLMPLYFVGRGITIMLALVTLGTLPLDAYRDMEWSDFFPHI